MVQIFLPSILYSNCYETIRRLIWVEKQEGNRDRHDTIMEEKNRGYGVCKACSVCSIRDGNLNTRKKNTNHPSLIFR